MSPFGQKPIQTGPAIPSAFGPDYAKAVQLLGDKGLSMPSFGQQAGAGKPGVGAEPGQKAGIGADFGDEWTGGAAGKTEAEYKAGTGWGGEWQPGMKGQEGGEAPPEVDWMDEEKKKKEDEEKETEKVSPPPEEGPAQMTEEEKAEKEAENTQAMIDAIKAIGGDPTEGGAEEYDKGTPLTPAKEEPVEEEDTTTPAYFDFSDIYAPKDLDEDAIQALIAAKTISKLGPQGTVLSAKKDTSLKGLTEDELARLIGKDTEAFSEEEKAQMYGLIDKEAAQAMSDMSQQMGARGFGASGVAATGLGGIASAAAGQKAEFDIQARQMTIESEINRLKTIATLYAHELSEENRMFIAGEINSLEREKHEYDVKEEAKANALIKAESDLAFLGLDKYDSPEELTAALVKNGWPLDEAGEMIDMLQEKWAGDEENAGNWTTMPDGMGKFVSKEEGSTWTLNKPDWMSDDGFAQLKEQASGDFPEWADLTGGGTAPGAGHETDPFGGDDPQDHWNDWTYDQRVAFLIAASEWRKEADLPEGPGFQS